MGPFENIWNGLQFSAAGQIENTLDGWDFPYRRKADGNLVYASHKSYGSAVVFNAQRLAYQMSGSAARSMLSEYIRYTGERRADEFRSRKESEDRKLIRHFNVANRNYGELYLSDTKETVVAQDRYGNKVEDSLIISYEGDVVGYSEIITDSGSFGLKRPKTPLAFKKGMESDNSRDSITNRVYKTRTVFVIDLNPHITMQSSKNVVLTKVQGRDFTRKELVSGGDLTFTVSGELNSNFDGVYPEGEVRRFVSIMQHGGVVDVSHRSFGQLNVRQVIVQSYSLGKSEFYNIQPYQFTCVAVEPDEAVSVRMDTIDSLNYELSMSRTDGWYNFILNSKLAEIAAKTAANAATSFANAGLDKLMTGI